MPFLSNMLVRLVCIMTKLFPHMTVCGPTVISSFRSEGEARSSLRKSLDEAVTHLTLSTHHTWDWILASCDMSLVHSEACWVFEGKNASTNARNVLGPPAIFYKIPFSLEKRKTASFFGPGYLTSLSLKLITRACQPDKTRITCPLW